jgi:ATP-dependent Clp protease ATP-binding subunit ClpC
MILAEIKHAPHAQVSVIIGISVIIVRWAAYARPMSESAAPVPTPRYFSVLGAAEGIARGMSHGYVGVEHLFLAIIRDRDAVPTQVLATMADLADVESALRDLMNSDGYRTGTGGTAALGDST